MDGPRTDRRVLVLALARMADALGNSFLIVVLPLYLGSGAIPLDGLAGSRLGLFGVGFALTEAFLVGLVLSLFGFLNSFCQPLTGRLSDRAGRRKAFILAGLAVLGAASGAYAFATSYHAVLVLRAIQGVGAALTIPATVALVNELSTADTRGNSFGVFNTLRLVGFGFGPLVAGALVQFGPYAATVAGSDLALSGFDAAFLLAVVAAFCSFALVSLLVSDPERTEASAADDLSVSVLDPDGRGLDPVFTLGVATVCMGITIALFATLERQINARLAQGELLFSAQFAAVVIANVLLQVPVGRASDRYGRRPFLVAGFVLLGPTTLAQGIVGSPGAMFLARLLQGVAVALVFAPSLAVAGDLAGEGESGTTLSVLTMGFGLGTAIGPLASGFLVRYGFVVPFAVGAALAALALALVFLQVGETRLPEGERDAAAVD